MGSSFNAGYIGSYYFENQSKIPSQIINASEFIDSGKIKDENKIKIIVLKIVFIIYKVIFIV